MPIEWTLPWLKANWPHGAEIVERRARAICPCPGTCSAVRTACAAECGTCGPDAIATLRAEYEAGWVMVPREATADMHTNGENAFDLFCCDGDEEHSWLKPQNCDQVFKAMVAPYLPKEE